MPTKHLNANYHWRVTGGSAGLTRSNPKPETLHASKPYILHLVPRTETKLSHPYIGACALSVRNIPNSKDGTGTLVGRLYSVLVSWSMPCLYQAP